MSIVTGARLHNDNLSSNYCKYSNSGHSEHGMGIILLNKTLNVAQRMPLSRFLNTAIIDSQSSFYSFSILLHLQKKTQKKFYSALVMQHLYLLSIYLFMRFILQATAQIFSRLLLLYLWTSLDMD